MFYRAYLGYLQPSRLRRVPITWVSASLYDHRGVPPWAEGILLNRPGFPKTIITEVPREA